MEISGFPGTGSLPGGPPRWQLLCSPSGGMLESVSPDRLSSLGPTELSDKLEQGDIVLFPDPPIPLPSAADQEFLRQEMPRLLSRKNISFHVESDRVAGLRGGGQITERARRILSEHLNQVEQFLRRVLPTLVPGWKVATSSFRPLEERGRAIRAHARSELVHVDAGAYGATHGDRILRFFVNLNPHEDRVWVSKGTFPVLYRRYAREAGIEPPDGGHDLKPGPVNRTYTGVLHALASAGFRSAKLADTSPYDRLMKRFHDWMKDTPEFQATSEGHAEVRFKPFSAWMVFADMTSHACLAGRYAFIDTFIIPLRNCRLRELAPYYVLQGRRDA